MTAPDIPTIELRTPAGDIPIPLLGLGTWQSDGDDAYRAVRHALEVGYRHVDTATAYGNEDQVGRGIADSGVDREKVFVTTKLPPDAAGRERETLEASLRALGTEYVDLWLVHWPPNKQATPATWQAFRDLRDEGLVRAIGVSNYSVAQIDELVDATGEAPAINQIPWSPADFDLGLVTAHAQRGVALEGYSPFKRTDTSHPVLTGLAEAKGVSVEQVVLVWHLRHRVVVIPKSVTPERIERNIDVLDVHLSDEEVAAIDALSTVGG
ncbi:aldo/keto reductase [Cellulomonas carbonis]|uniref:Aldo/keto reductase n=1 Tax=Cellulomonas carbonis T26 TaxID=947969 RepID=A0A0A0BKX0_9CELL|nr:aldo/keto reductase [Cellulomonas carbonis]KGM08525.1 aldo/keto reductase [Cellulomonas carbonis T26]GGC10986.1 putative oxidoreductase [Cellulomonas carbonis]